MKSQKKYCDRTSRLIKNKEGDVVWLKDTPKIRGEKKLADKWVGLYFILDVWSDLNFRVIDKQEHTGRVVHHDRMKPYETREPFDVRWVLFRRKTHKGIQDMNVQGAPDPAVVGGPCGAGVGPSGGNQSVPVPVPDAQTARRLLPRKRGRGRPKYCVEPPKPENPPVVVRRRGRSAVPEETERSAAPDNNKKKAQQTKRKPGRPRKQKTT